MDQDRTPQQHATGVNRSSTLPWVLIAITTILVLEIIADGYIRGRWGWDGTGFSGASLWNWLDLLIVPLVLGIGGIWFQRAQRQRELWIQEEQRQRESDLQEQRAQDTALQVYLDQMSELLIDKKLHDETKRHSDKRVTARARTLTVLGQLDGNRPKRVLQFLYETRLISRGEILEERVIQPRIVGLNGADLADANLRGSKLVNTSLQEVTLRGSDLRGADLRGADLSGANLSGANLSGANLSGAEISNKQLAACASLEGATMPDEPKHD